MNDAYIQGFMDKCSAMGVDPDVVLKPLEDGSGISQGYAIDPTVTQIKDSPKVGLAQARRPPKKRETTGSMNQVA